MFVGKLVFAQVMDFLPLHTFRRCVARYPSNYPTKTFSHLDQFLCMAFAQLTFRESLRDIEVCLRAQGSKLYHLGIRGHVARSNLADANEKRDWRIYRDFANALIVYSRPVDTTTGVYLDQTVRLTGAKSPDYYPQYLRCVGFYDEENDKRLKFFTNNFELPALTIAQLYKCRWQVELFFKWIKQHLRIKAFFGANENAVKIQIWIAISVYVLIAIIKKRLRVEASLYTILQILSLMLFEKTPLDQLLNDRALLKLRLDDSTQLNLFT
jgi:hypothetical protein